MQTVTISDVTMKSGVALSFKEKIEIAKLLDKIGISAIEMPVFEGEKRDALLIKSIASSLQNSVLSVACPLSEEGVAATYAAVCSAKQPRLQLVIPTSTVQMEYLCRKKPQAMLELIEALVKKAASLCGSVEFVAQDATRSEPEFLAKALNTAVEAGAGRITLSDDAGIMTPGEFASFVASMRAALCAKEEIVLGVQCNDTLSMAAACAISAVQAGASEIKTIVSGQQTAKLEAVSQFIRGRGLELGIASSVQVTQLQRAVRQMEWILQTESSKTSAFDAGVRAESADFVLSDHDGPAQVTAAIRSLGYDLSDDDNANVFAAFKRISAKKDVTARDLEAIIASSAMQVPPTYVLESYVINSGNVIKPTAHITMRKNEEQIVGLCSGDGPIDAAFLAVEQIVGHHYELDDFQIQAVTQGKEAMGSALVRLRANGKLYSGNGISTDIIGASIRAYLNALNKIVYEEG